MGLWSLVSPGLAGVPLVTGFLFSSILIGLHGLSVPETQAYPSHYRSETIGTLRPARGSPAIFDRPSTAGRAVKPRLKAEQAWRPTAIYLPGDSGGG